MKRSHLFSVLIALSLCHTALAAVAPPTASHPDGDRIMVGTIVEGTLQVGNVYGRDEYAMSVPIANYNPAFDFTLEGGITALAELKTPNKFAIGTGDGWLHSKDAFDLNWDGGVIMITSGSGGPLHAVGTLVGRTDGHIAGGTDGFGPANVIFYRDWTNVQQDAPVGGNAWEWYNNDDFVASDVLPNGNLVFAAAGYMWIVDQDNAGNALGETGFAFGNWVQDIAVDQTTGNIVVAHTYGGLETYDSANLGAGPIDAATLLSGGGSEQFTEVEVLSDGLVVAGTSLGTVYTFADSADLFADISGAFTFSSGAITALEVTSNDNVVIAAPSVNDPNKSVTWVRQGHNIDSPPVGMEGSDGALWDNHVHAIAAVPYQVLDGDIDGDGDVDKDDLAVMGGQWLACSDPGGQNCQPVRTIEAGTATVDADLGDWTNAHWIPLNQIYFQNPAEDGVPDVSEAKFALRWDAASDKIYCAVVVEDANNIYTDGWGGNWNVSDRIEIYSQGSAAGGSLYAPEHDFAQQYVIGANDTLPGAWAVFGFNEGPVGPSNAEIAVAKSPGQVIYEVAIVQYDSYAENGGDPNTVITDLVDGSTVGFDVLVGSKFSPDSADFGLLSENLDLDKNIHASNFAQYKLVQSATQCGDWGYFSADITEDCIVNYFDFSKFGLDWMMDINP
jgi:hypothetical protein